LQHGHPARQGLERAVQHGDVLHCRQALSTLADEVLRAVFHDHSEPQPVLGFVAVVAEAYELRPESVLEQGCAIGIAKGLDILLVVDAAAGLEVANHCTKGRVIVIPYLDRSISWIAEPGVAIEAYKKPGFHVPQINLALSGD